MRAVVQRVSQAEVRTEAGTAGAIGPGLLVYLGVEVGDGEDQAADLARRIAALRVFADDDGRMNLDAGAVDGGFLVVSQFTLCADTSRGRRPGFDGAMRPPESERLYERFCDLLEEQAGRAPERGVFGAHMDVDAVNDGPVTLLLRAAPD